MTPQEKEILNAQVVRITNFQSMTVLVNPVKTCKQWIADFTLLGGQRFHVRCDKNSYSFTPDTGYNKLPVLKEILWKRKPFCPGKDCSGLDTDVTLSDTISTSEKNEYQQFLSPTEMNMGFLLSHAQYRYVPMLETAIRIRYAYVQQIRMERALQKASRNLSDALALKTFSYDMRQYGC